MHTIRRAIEVLFVLTLTALLLGGIVFVAGQAIALVAGQGHWLTLLNDTIKAPMCIAASICARTRASRCTGSATETGSSANIADTRLS